MMNILNKLRTNEAWEQYKAFIENNQIFVDKHLLSKINSVIEAGVENITLQFPVPTKKEISKYKNMKKRTVYSFGEPYNTYLKCINYLLQIDPLYKKKFCVNSIAYQQGKSVKHYVDAMSKQIQLRSRKYFIKTDFTDYFNSIDLDILIKKMQKFFLTQDADLYELLVGMLSRKEVKVNGSIELIDKKGVMAGLPISGYLANVYMNDVDWEMYKRHIYYTRYADDVIILTNNIERDKQLFNELLEPLNVKLNPKKIDEGTIKDGVTFLGFKFEKGRIDISQRGIDKMKSRIKRRSKWFSAWLSKKNVKRDVAARTFIKGMNNKFYSRGEEDGTCWMEWYGKNLTTDESLKKIDEYMCQYIRYLLSGKQKGYKKNAEIPYETLKQLGFRPLVNEYWKVKKQIAKNNELNKK